MSNECYRCKGECTLNPETETYWCETCGQEQPEEDEEEARREWEMSADRDDYYSER